MLPVLFLDAGLALVAAGALGVLSGAARGPGAWLAAAGLLLVLAALAVPARAIRLDGPRMALDRLMPEYQFGESHEIQVRAPAARAYRAIREVTAPEIRFFRLLTWIRAPRLTGRGKQSILNPSTTRPILDVALDSGFSLVHDEPGRELVVGTLVQGSTKAFMNFAVIDAGAGSTRVVTQTRIHATSGAAARRFAAYWRLIYPGSAFIRRMWLRAIRARAEASG